VTLSPARSRVGTRRFAPTARIGFFVFSSSHIKPRAAKDTQALEPLPTVNPQVHERRLVTACEKSKNPHLTNIVPQALKEILGHATLNMTVRYASSPRTTSAPR
jgi:hypothetical protein